jgi:branched-chain amino acid transport system substrate-binding protein
LSATSDRLRLIAGLLAALGGCSATRFAHDPCTDHSQCRASFGFGAVCQPGGFCGPAEVAACDEAYPEDLLSAGEPYRDAIVLGALIDRSSPEQIIQEKAIRLAFKEALAGGGLDGRPVGVLLCDVQSGAGADADAGVSLAVQTARQLTGMLGVPALIGPAGSEAAQAVWEAVGLTGALVISPAATSEALGQLQPGASDEQPGLLWSAASSDRLQARAIASDLLARNVTRAYLLRETGLYGEGLARLVSDLLREAGGTVEVESLPARASIAAATAAVPPEDRADVLFISSQPSWIVEFLQQASARPGYDRRTIFLTDTAASPAVFESALAASGLFPRIRGTRPPLDGYTYASFAAGYRAEYGGGDPADAVHAPHAYDAAWLALYAAAWSGLQEGKVHGAGMARGLRRIGSGPPTPMIPASWRGVLAAFREGRTVDLRGASGELDYDLQTRFPAGAFELWQVVSDKGRFRAAPLEVATTQGKAKER